MPSTSKKQHNFMAAIAHSKEFSKKAGVPMSVGRDFIDADKGKKFRKGGSTNPMEAKIANPRVHHGQIQLPNASLSKYTGFKEGGTMKPIDTKKNPGLAKLPTAVRNKMGYMKKGGMADDAKEDMKMDKKQDIAMIKKAFKEHDAQEHKGGKGTKISLAKGGMMKETMGPRTMAMDVEKGSNKLTKFGESAVQKRGQTKGKNLGDSGKSMGIMGGAKGMAKGGSASSRADGIASKGKTRGKMC
jgi:hypothetical protein